MKLNRAFLCTLLGGVCLTAFAADNKDVVPVDSATWSPAAAGNYMDSREIWWQGWATSQRDHKTVCISCHSALPYALARPALRRDLKEETASRPEQFLLAGVTKRVNLWNEVEPFYSDEKQGAPKSAEARGTESVLNALILSSEDSHRSHLSDLTRLALDNFWALQLKAGDKAGAWNWLNFHLSPWESTESQYFGATMAALAVGMAPDHYSASPNIQEGVALLKGYLQREYDQQPLLNRVTLLWASTKLEGLLTPQQKAALVDAISARQKEDGGWSLSSLGTWKRRDDTQEPTVSDGYATGIIILALEETGMSARSEQVKRGLDWLQQNQNKTEGFWAATSLNKQKDPASDKGRFMTDAATAYAVLALEKARQ